MVEHSAGVLLWRLRGGDPGVEAVVGEVEVFVAHMGGPFWRRRERAWSIPKGLVEPGEDLLETARREFREEIGVDVPADVPLVGLGEFRQASGKRVTMFAGRVGPDFDVAQVRSNEFTVELPRGSGRMVAFPEVDEARWVDLRAARELLVLGQVAAIDALDASVGGSG